MPQPWQPALNRAACQKRENRHFRVCLSLCRELAIIDTFGQRSSTIHLLYERVRVIHVSRGIAAQKDNKRK
jgi:hypothetical protein